MESDQQTIAVIGGRGALGRRLVAHLAERPACRVRSIDRVAPAATDAAGGSVDALTADIVTSERLADVLAGCNTVVHLAAIIDVAQSAADPVRCFEINVGGTVRLLDACRTAGVQRFVYASTAHVYGPPESDPVDERHPTRPLSVYAASKLAAEAAVLGFGAGFNFTPVVCRLANLYGAAFRDDTVIGRAIRQAAAGRPIQLRNLDAVRDFLHVDDAVTALSQLAGADAAVSGIFNAGGGAGVSVRGIAAELAALASAALAREVRVDDNAAPVAEAVPRLVLDIHKMKTAVNWVPVVDLHEGLRRSLELYLKSNGSEAG